MRQSILAVMLLIPCMFIACREHPGEISGAPAANPEKIDWGKETTAAGLIAMAKKGEIRGIQWHVMPNIFRAEAKDGKVYYIRNENKGIDLRGMLIKTGIPIGDGGVIFQHVF
jgi:hypothetical protein